jgi:hypothetical protein
MKMPPNKRCSGLGWSARFGSPITLAAELRVMRLQNAINKINGCNLLRKEENTLNKTLRNLLGNE